MATSTPPEHEVDVVVVGGGPTGENVAQYAVEGGLSAALVEGGLLGGECSYYACMPSKALLRPVEVAAAAAHLGGLAAPALDRAGLLGRRDEWVSGYDDAGQAQWAAGAGIELVRGHGRLAGERLVRVEGPDGERLLRARRAVVLATGSEPVVPDAYAGLHAWGSRDATGVVDVPGRLLVVGGGVVACEAATWMAALGSEVTMVVRGDRLLDAQEPFAGDAVREGLEAAGVRVLLGTQVTEARRAGSADTGLGRVHGGPVTLVTGAGELEGDELLLATGRRPRLGDVGLEAVGRTPDDVAAGRLPQWLHAIGDAGPGAPLTHMGKHAARVLGSRLAGVQETPPPDDVPVPQVVFTDPQVATVGRTERQARADGIDVVTAEVGITDAAGAALLRDDASGRASLVVDRATGTVVGATFVGPEVAEVVHAATVAIVGRVPVGLLRHAVPAYPTASEVWLRLLEALPRELR